MMGMGSGSPAVSLPQPGQPGVDYVKLFATEKESLELAEGQYKWAAQGVERRMLARWGKLPAEAS